MLRYILNNLAGYLRIRVEGYSPERFLNLCCYHGIFLWNLRPAKGAYEMNIRVRDFRRLRPMVRKSRAKVRIIQKRGVPFFIHKYRGRKLFFTGSVIAICLIFLLSSFIWRIQIDGNLARTDEVLLSFLTEKGIACGMAKKNVDCDRIEKDIRMEYDDIIWVSAYVHGSCLKIKVRENPDRKELQTEAEAEAIKLKAMLSAAVDTIEKISDAQADVCFMGKDSCEGCDFIFGSPCRWKHEGAARKMLKF